MKKVLDKGYIRLADHMGNDTTVVNAARVSFDKSVEVLGEKDAKLIKFLLKHKHKSVFRHNVFTFEIYAPLEVARQWWKHAVGSTHLDAQNGWNESSRRYVTESPEFYVPRVWNYSPDNKKQGIGVEVNASGLTSALLEKHQQAGLDLYSEMLELGIAPEQARLFLPAYGMYVRWRWTVSLDGLLNFLDLRLAEGAQREIREYATAIVELIEPVVPVTMAAWKELK